MAKTKEELVTMIETELVDPTSNKITGERVKDVLTDIVDAMGTSGGGTMEYWSVPAPGDLTAALMHELIVLFYLCKIQSGGKVTIFGASYQLMVWDSGTIATAIAWDPNAKMSMNGEFKTTSAVLEIFGATSLADLGFTQITEEEFYTV